MNHLKEEIIKQLWPVKIEIGNRIWQGWNAHGKQSESPMTFCLENVKDDLERVYSIEMQMTDTKELPKRSRYYLAMIDLQLLDKGIRYRYLNDSYIIFICPFDLYGKGRHMYTFDGRCKEDPELTIEDGATRIFLNTKGTMEDVSASLRAFLDYVDGRLSDDAFVQELESAVDEAKKNREWRRE